SWFLQVDGAGYAKYLTLYLPSIFLFYNNEVHTLHLSNEKSFSYPKKNAGYHHNGNNGSNTFGFQKTSHLQDQYGPKPTRPTSYWEEAAEISGCRSSIISRYQSIQMRASCYNNLYLK